MQKVRTATRDLKLSADIINVRFTWSRNVFPSTSSVTGSIRKIYVSGPVIYMRIDAQVPQFLYVVPTGTNIVTKHFSG